ncbi:MAG: long-chain fatty acid--CoA ligase [Candidatus Sericytochromatia bacterium]|nr:long-chain fatty acid--CoA ligase [Candidatus Sericytochromatia bacterium]
MHFGDWLARWAMYTPEKTALVCTATHRRITYREFHHRVDALARALYHDLGLRKGDRVAVLAHNCVETLELFFAAGKLGAILVPVNWRLAAAEVQYILGDAAPKALFFGPHFEQTVHAVTSQLPIPHVVPYEAAADASHYEALLAQASEAAPPEPAISLDDPHLVLYTSGTTGAPKGAVLTHGTITWNAINTQVGWDLRHDDVTLTHTPFFHTGGFNVLTTPLIHRGGTIVLMPQFDAVRSLQLIDEHRITVVFAVPTMFQMMLESQGFATADLSSLRFFISGGAPCPVSLIEAYAGRGLTFKQGYGLTEAGPNCFTLDARDAVRKAGSVGFPNMHVDVRVVDDHDQDVPPGETGELLIKGPHVFPGYWNNETATRAAFTGGWLRTGDLVRRDAEGYFYIVDRKKDMFISGGENVYPAELENHLARHPHVAEAAIIGVPDAKWGEVGRAIVALRTPGALSEADVLAYLGEHVARYKLPRSVVFVPSLPRNATGKVVKGDLRKQFGQVLATPHPR